MTVRVPPAPSVTRSNPRRRRTGWERLATGSCRHTAPPRRPPRRRCWSRCPRRDRAVLPHLVRVQRQVRDLERRCSSGRNRRVQRVTGSGCPGSASSTSRRVARPTRGLVVVVDRDRPTRRGNETGSFPPGLTLPNTTSATALPASVAREPGLEDRRARGIDPSQRQRPAVEQHHHERLAGGLDCRRSGPPASGQIDLGAGGGLPALAPGTPRARAPPGPRPRRWRPPRRTPASGRLRSARVVVRRLPVNEVTPGRTWCPGAGPLIPS